MGKIKQSIILVLAFLVLIGAVFFTGYYVGSKGSARTAGEFEKRLSDVTTINKQLQAENSRLRAITDNLTRRLATVTERLDRAKNIVAGFSKQIDSDGDTIQRAIDTVSKLEQILSVILEDK